MSVCSLVFYGSTEISPCYPRLVLNIDLLTQPPIASLPVHIFHSPMGRRPLYLGSITFHEYSPCLARFWCASGWTSVLRRKVNSSPHDSRKYKHFTRGSSLRSHMPRSHSVSNKLILSLTSPLNMEVRASDKRRSRKSRISLTTLMPLVPMPSTHSWSCRPICMLLRCVRVPLFEPLLRCWLIAPDCCIDSNSCDS